MKATQFTLATLIALTALPSLAQTAAPAAAPAATPDYTITGNLGIFSDYRFRGISQTNKKPAIQGGVDFAHSSGIYLGNWNSNVDSGLYNGANIEMDFYGGWKTTVDDFGLDIGAIYYYYPGSGQVRARQLQGRQRRAVHRRQLGPDRAEVLLRGDRLLRRAGDQGRLLHRAQRRARLRQRLRHQRRGRLPGPEERRSGYAEIGGSFAGRQPASSTTSSAALTPSTAGCSAWPTCRPIATIAGSASLTQQEHQQRHGAGVGDQELLTIRTIKES